MASGMRLALRMLVLLLAAIVFTAAAAVAWVALDYWRMPVSERGFAYALGLQLGLSMEHLHTLNEGRPLKVVFRRREHDEWNKITWQRAQLARPGNCLDIANRKNGRADLPAMCAEHDKLTANDNRLFYSVDADRSISLGIKDTAPPGRVEAKGAVFGVEGEVSVGETFESATRFKIEVTAPGLNIADLNTPPTTMFEPEREGDEQAGGCDLPHEVAASWPLPLRLARTAARVCRFRANDGKVLALVQFTSGPLQARRWTDAVMCRGLVRDLTRNGTRPDFAACLGASWNEIEALALHVELFDMSDPAHPRHLR